MKRIINKLDDLVAFFGELKVLPMPFALTKGEPPKSHEQLGYLHAEVFPKLTVVLHEHGEIKRKSERECKYWLKRHIGYGEWIEFSGGVVFDPDSFSDASVAQMTEILDIAIEQATLRGATIKQPKEK